MSGTTEEQEIPPSTPVWCPEQQIYIGGVPGATDEDVKALLKENNGALQVFGYGSLCWNPGTGALGHSTVTSQLGHAKGYRRIWGQRSTDHRGVPSFPGIVCTLLQQGEVDAILQRGHSRQKQDDDNDNTNQQNASKDDVMVEGKVYLVPPALARECLAELDFREKGGYAREIIEVVEDDSGKTKKALLYRGTPDNPAFWSRIVWDLPLAAAVMSVSVGPSGPNDVYLNQLDQFLQHISLQDANVTNLIKQDDTCRLANMTHALQSTENAVYFGYACGSNQHGQILWGQQYNRDHDVNAIAESVVWCQQRKNASTIPPPAQLFSGGGHSALLTEDGSLFLWGWNEHGQCGLPTSNTSNNDNTENNNADRDNSPPFPILQAAPNIQVETAALGFSHTLVLEKETGIVWAFGDNSHGQVTGNAHDKTSVSTPTIPIPLQDIRCRAISAGLFHSAVLTDAGELIAFGHPKLSIQKWSPNDGSKLVHVSCGRHHIALVDNESRVWTMGDNKYGQLGRSVATENDVVDSNKKNKPQTWDTEPQLVDGPLGKDHDGKLRCAQLSSGWSHLVARVVSADGKSSLYGWGRSDKGQLASRDKVVPVPRLIQIPDEAVHPISQISCGSECTYVLCDAQPPTIYSCGWNEHGNLGQGDVAEENVYELRPLIGTERIVSPPTYSEDRRVLIAAGGAHFLAFMR